MKSFLHGKKTLSVAPLVPPQGLVPPRAAIHKAGPAHDAENGGSKHAIELVKEGDKVVRIIVSCSCGERVEIECLYPAGA